jgi:hypothetical protein
VNFVTELILSLAIAEPLEPFDQPLNSNVIFLKETDIISQTMLGALP